MSSCDKRVQGGEYYCPSCQMTWSRRDPNPPECGKVKKPKVHKINSFAELKEALRKDDDRKNL